MHLLSKTTLTQKQRSQAIIKAVKSGAFDREWGELVTFEDLITRSEYRKAIVYHLIDYKVFHFLNPELYTVNLLLVRLSDHGTLLEYAEFKRKLDYLLDIIYDNKGFLKAVRDLCRFHSIIASHDMKMKVWNEDPSHDMVGIDDIIGLAD